MRIGETLKKAAGLMFEFDESQNPPATTSTPDKAWSVMDAPATPAAPAPAPVPVAKSMEQVVRDAPGPNLDEIKPQAEPAGPVITRDGTVDFQEIYNLAKLPPASFSAEQVLELLGTFPPEVPIETKRQAVKITVGAMAKTNGVTTESIVADASRKLTALATYAQGYCGLMDDQVVKAQQDIVALEAEIEKKKQAIADSKSQQTLMSEGCHNESDRLDDVLEFFSLDVPPSKYAK